MTAITNGAVLERCNIDGGAIEHLDLVVPLLAGLQGQGDVLIVPVESRGDRGERIAREGVTVVVGESAGGNAHILQSLEGECFWLAASDAASGLVQGWLTVPDGSSAAMVHTQEHSVVGVAAGCFEVRRQREFAGEWARVLD
jgi:hypothetical protein